MKELSIFLLGTVLALGTYPADASSSIQCWGSNSQGQATVPSTLSLTVVPDAPIQVRMGRGMTCVLSQEGLVSCWGEFLPHLTKLQALTQVTDFAVSSGGACAITSNQVQCFSAIGAKDIAFETVPKLIHPKKVAVGNFFACAQDDNGIHCWGGNDKAISTVPKLISPSKFLAGESDVCALDANGIHCWGDDNYGLESVPVLKQPTDFIMGAGYMCATDSTGITCWGDPNLQSLPAIPSVPQASGVTQYVSGQMHLCGLDGAGVQCWGDNSFRQLDVPSLSNPQKLFADAVGNQTCALDDTGLVCWGEDQVGQSSLSGVSSISAGLGNTCATSQGATLCWGSGSTTLDSPLALGDAYQVATGSNFACAVDSTGSSTTSCWGDNPGLQSASPDLPILPNVQGIRFFSAPPTVTAGNAHGCTYLRKEIGILCFGNNDYGQIHVPIGFLSYGNAGTLSAGGDTTCAIDAVQGLQCWGRNDFGQATPPTTLKNPRQVSVGYLHACALDDNGVSCWGRTSEGQTTVPPLVHPRLIQSGGYHSCAVDDHGLTCWGQNSFGQASVPATLQGRISALSLGLYHSCAVTR